MAAVSTQVRVRPAGGQLNWPLNLATFVANDHLKSGAGGASAITITKDADRPIVIRQIDFGYDAAPAAGATIQVKDGTTVVWEQPVTAAGFFSKTFDPPKCGTKNTDMVITLSAGGGSILAYLDVNAYTEA